MPQRWENIPTKFLQSWEMVKHADAQGFRNDGQTLAHFF